MSTALQRQEAASLKSNTLDEVGRYIGRLHPEAFIWPKFDYGEVRQYRRPQEEFEKVERGHSLVWVSTDVGSKGAQTDFLALVSKTAVGIDSPNLFSPIGVIFVDRSGGIDIPHTSDNFTTVKQSRSFDESPSVEIKSTDASRRTEKISVGQGVDAAIKLLDQWLADESGYDEDAWPGLKAALEKNRLSRRKLFDD